MTQAHQDKKNGPNERTDQSSRKIQASNKKIDNLSDAQFKTLVIRMLTELVEYGRKLDEKMKAMLSGIKANVQGTNSDGKETGTQINGVDQKEETSHQKRMKKQESPKTRRGLGTSRTSLSSNIRIIGVPGEELEQGIENIFEKIMKENFPNLAKEMDFQGVQEAQRVPKKLDSRKHTPRHITITLLKIKAK